MKSSIFTALLLLVLLSGLAIADGGFEDDEILIRLQPGVQIDTINTRYNTTTSREVVPGVTYKVRVSDPNLLTATLALMMTDGDLVWSQNSYLSQDPTEGSRRTLAVIDGDPSQCRDDNAWERVKAPEAHDYSTGKGVIVAVIDTGVDYNHPDLTDHILRDLTTNQVIGWDFVNNDADPMDDGDGIDNDGDGLIDEGAGHGTHISGIIAQIAPDAKIMPLRVLDSEGNGTADLVADAIRYVVNYQKNVDPNAKIVINLSLGIKNVTRVEVIHDAIDDEITDPEPPNLPLPISVVASAGNDGLPVVHYPASESDVLSIAAVDARDKKADFSNYKDVDVAAPGVCIHSTFWANRYASWDGTSMATPFVSGEVALIKATETGTPRLDRAVETLVQQATDNISRINPGIDLGSGRINLLKAVQKSGGLTVKKAVYKAARQKLLVKVRSAGAPSDVLNVEGFGAMTYDPARKVYTLKVTKLAPAPATVTVTSFSFSSSITTSVKLK